MAVTYKLIETVTVGSGGAASIEFGSIPQTYTDLVLVGSLRSTSTSSNTGEYDAFGYRFNSSTSGYTTRNLQGNGSVASSSTQTTMTASVGGTYGRISNAGINNSLSAVYLNNGYLVAPDNFVYFYPDFTVMMWIKIHSHTSGSRIFDFGGPALLDNVCFGISLSTNEFAWFVFQLLFYLYL